MAIPAYMWLKDDGGADIKGSVTVQGREGSVELVAFDHGVHIPTDGNTGKLTGTRIHLPITLTKETDAATPYLYKAVTSGQTLKSVEIKWYKIDDAGKEQEYFNTKLENVKIVAVKPKMHDTRTPTSKGTTTSRTSSCATKRSPGRTRTATSSTRIRGTSAPDIRAVWWKRPASAVCRFDCRPVCRAGLFLPGNGRSASLPTPFP
ncbi:type VI secretion system secreted protein Hcp [Burkholderia multivorans]